MEIIPLRAIAYARSGDKGSDANIGIIAYKEKGYQFIKENLTGEMVHQYFKKLGPSKTIRYELDNLWALNFVLFNVLAGGGSRSLRNDAQGKTLGMALLEMPIKISAEKLRYCLK